MRRGVAQVLLQFFLLIIVIRFSTIFSPVYIVFQSVGMPCIFELYPMPNESIVSFIFKLVTHDIMTWNAFFRRI